jgi:uncharacterized protein with HEPN domain
MKKDVRVYLAHILECVRKIERFTAPGKRRFLNDDLIQDAVLRNFEVIGEAAKRIDETYRLAHPQIPWRAMAGLRDVLIHQYEGVDVAKVWEIIRKDLPPLKRALERSLPPLETLERELAGESPQPPPTPRKPSRNKKDHKQ